MSLLVIGTVAFDDIETPNGKSGKILGGAATYIGMSASYCGMHSNLVAVVGEDFPQEHIDMMKNHKINVEGLQIKQGEKSFYWSGRYHDNMISRDTLVTELNVLETFDPVIPDSYQGCEYLMLGNLAPVVQRQVIERLHTRPKFIVLDTMNFWMDIAMDDLKETIKMVDVITINDEEARQLSGEHSLVKAAAAILEMGPKYIVIKKGEHGALLFDKEKMFFAPALPLESVEDPTGAGDTFAGGFIGYIASTGDTSFENMKRAILHGSVLASFCVEKFGTENLQYLDDARIEQRIEQFLDLTRVNYEFMNA